MVRKYSAEDLELIAAKTPDQPAADALCWAANLIRPPQPDWEQAPANAVAFAVSPSGQGVFFTQRPSQNATGRDWESHNRVGHFPGYLRLAYDWKDTLVVRPTEEQRLADKYGLSVEQIKEIRGNGTSKF